MSYGNKYKIPFRELHTNELWEVYIQEEEYAGNCSDLVGTAAPLMREYRPENDTDYDIIKPSICTISFNSMTDHQFIEFFTSDDRKYKILIYRTVYAGETSTTTLLWAGWVLPGEYKEPYVSPTYEVSITASDGLLSLKEVDWEPVNSVERAVTNYTGKKSLMKGIESTIGKLGLGEVNIWEAGYIYEQNHDTDYSPFTQTYFDCERFYDDEDLPLDCYTVLTEILKTQNCQIFQENGYWNIVPQNARKGSYLRRKFIWTNVGYWSLSLSHVSSETYNPGITVDNTNYVFYSDPGLNFRPPWKKFSVKQDYSFDSNLLRNVEVQKYGDWNVSTSEDDFFYLEVADTLAETTDNYLEWNLGSIIYNSGDLEYLTISFKCYGPHDVAIFARVVLDGTTDYYLSSAIDWNYALWNTSSNSVVYNDRMDQIFQDKKSTALPISGTLKLRIYQPWKMSGGTHYLGITGFYLKDLKVNFSRSQPVHENRLITTLINDKNTFVPPTWEMMLGDLPYPSTRIVYAHPPVPIGGGGVIIHPFPVLETFPNQQLVYDGGLYWLDGSTYTPTTLWTAGSRESYNKLANVIADEISVNHLDPQWVINGDLYGVINYGAILTIGDKKYMILRASHNAYDKEWDLELFEIADTEQGYLRLRTGGYIKLRTGDKIKVR